MSTTNFHHEYRSVVSALKEAFEARLKTIVLFGSHARGQAHPGSDHDIFIVIEDLPKDPVHRNRVTRMSLLPVLEQLPGAISFIAKTPLELDQNLTPLVLDVCVDGVCLYGETFFEPYRQRAVSALDQAKLRREQIGESWVWRFAQIPVREWELNWDGYRERHR